MKNETNQITQPLLATAKEIAPRYSQSERTIKGWARKGILPSVRIGHRTVLYPVAECDEAMARLTVNAKEVAR